MPGDFRRLDSSLGLGIFHCFCTGNRLTLFIWSSVCPTFFFLFWLCFKWTRSKGIRDEMCAGLRNVDAAKWSKSWPMRAQLTLGELKREARRHATTAQWDSGVVESAEATKLEFWLYYYKLYNLRQTTEPFWASVPLLVKWRKAYLSANVARIFGLDSISKHMEHSILPFSALPSFHDHLEGWDREGGRKTQEGGDMGICVYV